LTATDRDPVQVRPAAFQPAMLVLTQLQGVPTALSELQPVSAQRLTTN